MWKWALQKKGIDCLVYAPIWHLLVTGFDPKTKIDMASGCGFSQATGRRGPQRTAIRRRPGRQLAQSQGHEGPFPRKVVRWQTCCLCRGPQRAHPLVICMHVYESMNSCQEHN